MKAELSPENRQRLAHVTLKGVGAVVVVIALIAALATVLHLQTGDPLEPFFDAGAAILLFTTIRSYSRAAIQMRWRIAEEADGKDPAQVVAALSPFLTPWGRRIDRQGRARAMYAKAAQALVSGNRADGV